MTDKDKKELVTNFCNSVRDEVVKKIEEGKIPENWDGHELRVLIAEKFNFEVTSLMREPRSKRMKACKNDIIVHNL